MTWLRDLRSLVVCRQGGWKANCWLLVVPLIGIGSLGLLWATDSFAATCPWLSIILAFGLLCIWPGFLTFIILFNDISFGFWTLIPVSTVLGMGLLIPFSTAVAVWHGNMQFLLLLYVLLITGLTSILLLRGSRVKVTWADRSLPQSASWTFAGILLFGAVLLGLILFMSRYVSYIGTKGDALTYLSYIRHYRDAARIDVSPPPLGSPQIEFMQLNGLLVFQALLSYVANVDPVPLIWIYLPYLLVFIALFGSYSLMQQLFGSHRAALFATGLTILYYLFSLTSDDQPGYLFFYRIVESKVFAWQILLPVVLLFALRYLGSGRKSYVFAMGLGGIAAAFTHPIGPTLISLSLGSFIALRWLITRQKSLLRRGIVLGIVLVLLLTIPLYMRMGTRTSFSLTEEEVEPRQQLLVDRLDIESIEKNEFIADVQLVSHPFTVTAIALTALLLLFIPSSQAAQFLVANMVVPLVLMYTPGLVPLFSQIITPWQLWRIGWIMPVAGVIAFVVFQAGQIIYARAGRTLERIRHHRGYLFIVMVLLLTGVALVSLPLASTLSALDSQPRNRPISEAERELLTFFRDHPAVEGVVIAPSSISNQIPGYSDRLELLTFRGKSFVLPSNDWEQRLVNQSDFLTLDGLALLTGREDLADEQSSFDPEVERTFPAMVDYVVLGSHKPLNFQLQNLPSMFSRIYTDNQFAVYEVAPELSVDHLVMGNTLLVQGATDAAVAAYELALLHNPGNTLAHFGIAQALQIKGNLDQALIEYGKVFVSDTLSPPSGLIENLSDQLGIERFYLLAYLHSGENFQTGQATDFGNARYATYSCLDNLDPDSTPGSHIHRSAFLVNGQPRGVLFQQPSSQLSYSVLVPASAHLVLGLALAPEVWQLEKGDGVRYNVTVQQGATQWYLLSEYIDPKNIPAHRKWNDREIDLSMWAGEKVTITLATTPGPNGDDRYDWAGWGEPRIVQPITYNFLAELPKANRGMADEEQVRQDTLVIDYEQRLILFQHPTSQVTYRLEVPQRAGLHFGLGLDPVVWSPDKGDGVEYNIYVHDPDEPNLLYRVYHRYLDPKNNVGDRHWVDEVVDLSTYGGQTVELTFEALPGPAGDTSFDWGGWSRPVLVADDMAILNPAPAVTWSPRPSP